MARRKKQSTAEDIMDAVARLPWWAGVGLAMATYVLFHWLAGRPQRTFSDARQFAGVFNHMIISGVATALQFVVPIFCAFGAVMSLVRRKKRTELVATVTQSPSADALNGMSWQEFELLVGEAFRLQGYVVQEQGGAGPDGGVDLVLQRGRETLLVQCKQWRAMKVGVDVVRELYGVMAARGAAGGFVVTSGRFTDDAVAFAAGRNLRLVDGPKLLGLLQQAKTSLAGRPAANASLRRDVPAQPATTDSSQPSCPTCSATMVRRTARKGGSPGSQFWGCSRFPACRGTR